MKKISIVSAFILVTLFVFGNKVQAQTSAPTVFISQPAYYSNSTAYINVTATNVSSCIQIVDGSISSIFSSGSNNPTYSHYIIVDLSQSGSTGNYSVRCTGPGGTTTSNSVNVTTSWQTSLLNNPPVLSANVLGAVDSNNSTNNYGFKVGEKIKVKAVGNINVRANAGRAGKSLGAQPNGATGVIVDGPVTVNGKIWYKVNYKFMQDGWSLGEYLELNN